MNKQELISKIKSLQDISSDEKAYLIELVNTKKKYGLVWEDKPEDVEEQLRSMLPVFKEVKERAIISENTEASNHILIEGDNLHALTALSYTHEGKVDVIYIDPPYNTGNKDFIYNDAYVDKEDSYRHSKWLSFMDKRLRLAKKLLSEKGVIFISIDDNEQSQLKLLCDEVFGEKNFISNIIWSAGKKNDSKYVSNSHEYILCYFKNIEYIKSIGKIWRIRKEGLDEIYKKSKEILKNTDDYEIASNELKKWYKQLPNDNPSKRHNHYSMMDENGVFFPDNISWPGGGGPKYEVLHPITNKPVTVPSRGWVYSSIERMNEIISQGKVHFGKDEKTVPTLKSYLKDREFEVPYSVLYQDGRASTKRLREILNANKFNNPKDEKIINILVKIASSKNSIVLDFFAGSGTTLHATMALNAEDGGNRQCILVTNNENKIAEEVTYERNKRIIQGYTNAKGEQVEGLVNNNLRYFQADFVPSERTEINRRLLTARSTELLCIKEDCFVDVTKDYNIKERQAKLFTNGVGKYMIVIYHSRNQEEVIAQLTELIQNLETTEKIKLYAFSPEKESIEEDFFAVADKIAAVPLPDSIYNAYRATFRTLKLNNKPAAVNSLNQDI